MPLLPRIFKRYIIQPIRPSGEARRGERHLDPDEKAENTEDVRDATQEIKRRNMPPDTGKYINKII